MFNYVLREPLVKNSQNEKSGIHIEKKENGIGKIMRLTTVRKASDVNATGIREEYEQQACFYIKTTKKSECCLF